MEKNAIQTTLEKHNLRKTAARAEILQLFYNEAPAVSHSDLEVALLNRFDRVTIYRTLNSFEEKGIIHKVFDSSGIGKYALCHQNCSEEEHHDEHVHFNCTNCGNTYCLESAEIPKISIPEKFKAKSFYLIAEGICATCSEKTDFLN